MIFTAVLPLFFAQCNLCNKSKRGYMNKTHKCIPKWRRISESRRANKDEFWTCFRKTSIKFTMELQKKAWLKLFFSPGWTNMKGHFSVSTLKTTWLSFHVVFLFRWKPSRNWTLCAKQLTLRADQYHFGSYWIKHFQIPGRWPGDIL